VKNASIEKWLLKKQAKPVMEPKDMPWGQRSAIVADPDGKFIEIGSFNKR